MTSDLISRSALLGKATNVTKYDEGGWCMVLKAVSVEDVLKAPAVDAVVLPCKVGDEFWTVYCNEVRKVKVSMITQKADKTWKVRFSVFNGWGSSINCSIDATGEKVFLTREEAEAALRKRTED